MVSNRNLGDSRGLFSGDILVSGRVCSCSIFHFGVFSIISRIFRHVNDTTHQKISNQPEFKRFSCSKESTKKTCSLLSNVSTCLVLQLMKTTQWDATYPTLIMQCYIYMCMQIHTFHEINMDGTNYRFSNFMKKQSLISPFKNLPIPFPPVVEGWENVHLGSNDTTLHLKVYPQDFALGGGEGITM